ncbi:MAG TPA: cation:proton antiporter [Terriglobia bacterium]|nr:cation:proton antiporter [Terriglobia bacterium]
MQGPADAHVESLLLNVLIQLIVIVIASRLAGMAFRKLGQPQVCGEIAAGLILGPSLLGKIAPDFFNAVFPASSTPVLNILSQLGLIFLMFLVGLDFDFSHLRSHGKTAVATSIAGVALPFGLGLAVAYVIHPVVAAGTDPKAFALLLATGLAITAIPVLSRIMTELNIHRSPVGTITITAAATDDVIGWIILAMAAGVVRAQFQATAAVSTIAQAAIFCVVTIYVARPLLKGWIRRTTVREGTDLSLSTLAVLLVLIMGAAAITNAIGIFSIFGAFLLGAILHDERQFVDAVVIRLRDFTTGLFLPIFFTYTGLRTDIGSMSGVTLWMIAGLIIAAAVVGKLGGCALAARFVGGLSWRDSAVIGILMNTRGLMELIVINLGYELGVFPRNVYFMLVLMTLVTTYMTTPLVRYAIRNTALERLVDESPFVVGRRKTVGN